MTGRVIILGKVKTVIVSYTLSRANSLHIITRHISIIYQASGVGEGDIAKTDGTYLYVREDNGRTIDIVDVRNGLKKYNEITLGEEYNIQEFYVNTEQRKLIVVCQKDCTDKNSKKQVNTDNWNQSNTAKELAEEGHPSGTFVVADQQTAGKGRRGRSWDSLPGTGIYMTLMLKPDINPNHA